MKVKNIWNLIWFQNVISYFIPIRLGVPWTIFECTVHRLVHRNLAQLKIFQIQSFSTWKHDKYVQNIEVITNYKEEHFISNSKPHSTKFYYRMFDYQKFSKPTKTKSIRGTEKESNSFQSNRIIAAASIWKP